MIKNKRIITAIIAIIGVLAIAIVAFAVNANSANSVEAESKTTKVSKSTKIVAKKAAANKKALDAWKHPSESKKYPDLDKHKDAYIEVSIPKQRVYIKENKDILYTMKAATGEKKSPTPKGTFQIQNRGDSFYNAESKEGANYWTSFKDWGVYLFHSVPTDKDGKYVEDEAHKLGKRSSHGCVRLTIPDAKWINSTVPDGMKVIVK
ncbi:L,D-transpeptidase [Companilactobacillus huachuanensis]|uniref:L,D-transpeptidase n=1 Tax=Companilactobacillus huachuanensis TaxID=2559914 RepID=A0ABW1RLD7_9LACO|nr:L,D-transpeptidase [Companilactobacillus huachuanensis]